jgi:hypothetical protein
MRKHLLFLAVLAGLLPLLLGAPAEAASPVHITKIRYAQVGTNLNTEYIVFKNSTSHRVAITGWRIISSPSTDNQVYRFPTTYISAGSSLTLYTGHGTNVSGRRYWGASSSVWDNHGDYAVLRNSLGTTMDTCRYAGGGTTAYC